MKRNYIIWKKKENNSNIITFDEDILMVRQAGFEPATYSLEGILKSHIYHIDLPQWLLRLKLLIKKRPAGERFYYCSAVL